MLLYLRRSRRYELSLRKLRLFACRCVRRIRNELLYQESEDAIVVAEQYADGHGGQCGLVRAQVGARQAISSVRSEGEGWSAHNAAKAAWCITRCPRSNGSQAATFLVDVALQTIGYVLKSLPEPPNSDTKIGRPNEYVILTCGIMERPLGWVQMSPRRWAELAVQAEFLRDLFGNPFRQTQLDPAWLTDPVVALARTTYRERKWDLMPILGDALEEAGCTDETILHHCRGKNRHARGCWLLDLLLGRNEP
jgi:hypothetical protein